MSITAATTSVPVVSYMPAEDRDAAMAVAELEDRSLSALVRRAVAEYVAAHSEGAGRVPAAH